MNNADAKRWDERYSKRTHEHGSEPAAFLREQVRERCVGRALVLAMGSGRNAVFLAQQGFEVTGVDVSRVGVERANALAARRGVKIEAVVADLCTWDLGVEKWDLITQFFYLEGSLFPKLAAALKPGGRFVMEHFSSDHPLVADFGPRNPQYLLAPNELPQLLRESGLRLLLYQDCLVELGEEGRHKGNAALVRAVAEKPKGDSTTASPTNDSPSR